MRSIPMVPATAPPTSAPPSGSPPTERAGAPGDFAATLTNIATARTALAEGHKEADKPAADDQPTAGERERDQQSALDPAPVVPVPADPAVTVASGPADGSSDDADTAPEQVDGAMSAVPMASVLAMTTAALDAPVAVTSVTAATPAPVAAERAPAPTAVPTASAPSRSTAACRRTPRLRTTSPAS